MTKRQFIRRVTERGDILCGDDGYYVYWPTGNGGSLSSHNLRVIADELDRRNAKHDRQVKEYFDKNQ